MSFFSLLDTTIFSHLTFVCFLGLALAAPENVLETMLCSWRPSFLLVLFFSRTHENMGKLKRRENCSIRRVVVGGCARHPRRWNYPHKHRAHIIHPAMQSLTFLPSFRSQNIVWLSKHKNYVMRLVPTHHKRPFMPNKTFRRMIRT